MIIVILFFNMLMILPLYSNLTVMGESEIEKKQKDDVLNFYHDKKYNYFFTKHEAETNFKENTDANLEKGVIIMFDRGYVTQFYNAKPILDKYGYKASFFIVCSFINNDGYYELHDGQEVLISDSDKAMSWNQIRTLHREGHDIESHGFAHKDLRNLHLKELEKEIAESKICLNKNGLEPVYFQNPNNKGHANSTIVQTISKYFDFALGGHSKLMFLNCDGWKNYGYKMKIYKGQRNCSTYTNEGHLALTNKYSIKEWSHDRFHEKLNDKHPFLDPHGIEINEMLFEEFVKIVESQKEYNLKAGKIVAIPIIGYHSIDTSERYDTSIQLFDKEMNYLYENGYRVLKLTDIDYNEKENHFYIKQKVE